MLLNGVYFVKSVVLMLNWFVRICANSYQSELSWDRSWGTPALGETSSQTLAHFNILWTKAFRTKRMGNVFSAWRNTLPKVVGEGWTPFHWICKLAQRFPYWVNMPCKSMRAWAFLTMVLDLSSLPKEVIVNVATTSFPHFPSPFLKVPRTSFCTVPQTGLPLSCLALYVKI